MNSDVAAQVCEIVKEKLAPAHQTTFDMQHSFEKLGVDELDKFEITIRVEEVFALEISDDDADTWICSQDIVAYVQAKK